MFKLSRQLVLLGSLLTCIYQSANATTNDEDKLKASFIKQAQALSLPEQKVTQILTQAKYNQAVIDAISKPWEAKPWHQYYPIFLTDKRLKAGLDFWHQYSDIIERASTAFEVDAEIIVAIIGIETFYGQYKGNYKVLDSLYTLGFHYPPRAKFFRSELAQLLALVDEEQLNIDTLQGSYAGAMGFGQFIPSSYRHYAVDFDHDGKRDLLNSPADAIGSVANYFRRHGWQMGQNIALPLHYSGNDVPKATPWSGEKLHYKIADILTPDLALATARDIDISKAGMLLALEQPQGGEYWLGLKNFYVITRYNHSPLYAMAVLQFSQQLKQAYAN